MKGIDTSNASISSSSDSSRNGVSPMKGIDTFGVIVIVFPFAFVEME